MRLLLRYRPRLSVAPMMFAAISVSMFVMSIRAAEPGEPLSVHMIGVGEYKPVESLTLLKTYLEKRYKVTCTTSFGKRGNQPLPNLEALKSAELMIIFARRTKLPEEQMVIIRSHWEQGKPIVGIRTASHAFQAEDNAIFDRQVLGGNYIGYTKPIEVIASESQTKHPILHGVESFHSRFAYRQGELAKDVVVLQVGRSEGSKRPPISWIHTYKGGRIFYTAIGWPDNFQEESFRRLLANAVLWTTHRDPKKMKK